MASTAPSPAPLQSSEDIVSRALQLAGRIGRHGMDRDDVSYTSLFIALLWLDDETSKWLWENIAPFEARIDAVHARRGVSEIDRAPLRAAAFSGEDLITLAYSPSARTVLSTAQKIANESSTAAPGVVGTRHILATYLFRNPPDHQEQLEKGWGFNMARWRPAFVKFISGLSGGGDSWRPIFAPYIDPESLEELPVMLAERYKLSQDAAHVIQQWWDQSESTGRAYRFMRSKGLFEALGGKERFVDWGDGNPQPAGTALAALSGKVVLSSGSRHVLDGAQSLAFTTTGMAEVGVRHLAAAVILVKDSNAHRELSSAGEAPALRRQRLLSYLNRNHFDDDAAQWRQALIGQREPDVAAYKPDDPEKGEDQLDVRRFAAAFALLIASKDVASPLAIGISGNWGSGKSFFMRLMRKETARIMAMAAADPRFHSNVIPIQFNAWHYAEKDLLASLVQAIFQELQNVLSGPRDGGSGAEAVLSRLEKARAERDEAEKRAEQARAAVEASARQLEETRRQAALRTEQAKLSGAEVAAASAGQLKRALAPLGLQHLEELIDEGADRASQVRAALAHVQSTGLQTRSALEWLLRAPVYWPGVIAALIVVAATGVAFFVFQDSIRQAWPVVAAVLTELGAIASLVWRWANKQLDKVDAGLAEFDKVRHAIEAKAEEKRAELNKHVEAAQKNLNDDAAKLKTAQDSVAAASAKVADAERALEETKSINQLARMVDERLTSRDYEKYLGLVAAVRADFQALSLLIQKAAKEAEGSTFTFRRIDRIVLYIDDLDRCPTDKVILVLEAIHLLLAFDLFVVVVGLDIRWASHSLEERFVRHLKADGGATALDYLEKIFQVPFWLPPMDEQASRQLLTTMLPGRAGVAEQSQNEHRGASEGSSEKKQAANAGEEAFTARQGTAATQETEMLNIQRGERAFMLQLAPAVSRSPRRLKRFVNTYLILRASLDPVERESFVLDAGARGSYREAMMLLALLTSAPRAWTRVLAALESIAPPQGAGDLRKVALDDVAPGEREYVEAAFDIYRSGPNSIEDLRTMAPKVARFSFHYSFS